MVQIHMKKLDPDHLERSLSMIMKLTSQNFLLSLMRVLQSGNNYPTDIDLRLDNVVSLLSAGVSEEAVLELVETHLEGVADVRMMELCTVPNISPPQRKGSKND